MNPPRYSGDGAEPFRRTAGSRPTDRRAPLGAPGAGTGKADAEIFATQVKLGSGWNSYYTVG
ncbi:hypothetical protein [Streptomyces sp. NPDC101181]|uniref:hypothetical protein n=1 Tax=Streptomyces sp. NPDC101181 TaxID=3366125 RepID=UPI00382837FD